MMAAATADDDPAANNWVAHPDILSHFPIAWGLRHWQFCGQ